MSIPDYQSIMYPLLELLRDGQTRSLRECIELLSSHFGLTRQERSQLLPSGQQPVFDNRVGWARTYLKKAGLLESPGRGLVRITPRGRKAVEQAGPRLDVNFLMQFEEFRDFRCRSQARRADLRGKAGGKNADPVERIEEAFNDYQDTLVDELLGQIRTASPAFFERLVIRLLVKMGYGGGLSEAATVVGGSGDEGIDGVINEDKLGLDVIYVQAKQWSNPVGRPEVQKFVGALHGKRAKKGVFLTSSVFTQGSRRVRKAPGTAGRSSGRRAHGSPDDRARRRRYHKISV